MLDDAYDDMFDLLISLGMLQSPMQKVRLDEMQFGHAKVVPNLNILWKGNVWI